jgi:hypothetical protein
MWQVIANGQPVGTYPEEALVRWAYEGRVNPNDLFWRQGMSAAMPAHLVLPFASALEARQRVSVGSDPALRWILPVGRSGWAIAAGYLGLFSLLLVPGPLALICGVVAINDIQKHASRHGMGRAIFGVVAGTLGSLGLALVIAAGLNS